MRSILLSIFILLTFTVCAQQTPRYTQYTFNNLGMNPAYAGSNPNKFEAVLGRRNQWYGFDNAPVNMFASFNYGYRGKYSFKGWHGFSAYIETEKLGAFNNKSSYLGYAYHFRVVSGIRVGFGLMAGIRSFGMGPSVYNPNDPAFTQTKSIVYSYPDFIPGVRIYSKRFFMDFSVRQIYKNKIKQGDKAIGTNSKLIPSYYFTYGRKIHLGYEDLLMVPTVHIQSSLLSIPQVDANVMFYYRKRIGIGANYRISSSFSGIIQIGITKNIVAGFSYDYTINKLRNVATNSYEFMIGFSPVMSDEQTEKRTSVARCPSFDF